MFMFLARIQALGLSFPPAEYRVYPGIFRPLMQASRYHGYRMGVLLPLSDYVVYLVNKL
jgi:hypothetical protein